jgi:hypothetical protein
MTTMFNCYSLVDITNTGTLRYSPTESAMKRDQQRNWETLVQSISLRAQPVMLNSPTIIVATDITAFSFNQPIQENTRIWHFTFGSEHTDIYTIEQLMQELHQIPITTGLFESVKLPKPIFDTLSKNSNTYFTHCGK